MQARNNVKSEKPSERLADIFFVFSCIMKAANGRGRNIK